MVTKTQHSLFTKHQLKQNNKSHFLHQLNTEITFTLSFSMCMNKNEEPSETTARSSAEEVNEAEIGWNVGFASFLFSNKTFPTCKE